MRSVATSSAGLAFVLATTANGHAAPLPSRLRITNGCTREPLWVAHIAAAGVGPDPQNVRLAPLQSRDFATPDGLSGARYWPKMRCDAKGSRCELGESGGPGELCGEAGCAPPVDTKFEASFGTGGVDWVDISLVDGFTLPFKLELRGNCSAKSKVVDCSQLSFEQCPAAEHLAGGAVEDLRVVHPDTRQVVGCASPCSKLTLAQWGAAAVAPTSDAAAPYCCPTPPESPHACRNGPVPHTRFVQAVHSMCPGVYGYSYDDGMGLVRCSADTHYEVTFYCPPEQPAPTSLAPARAPLASVVLPSVAPPAADVATGSPSTAEPPRIATTAGTVWSPSTAAPTSGTWSAWEAAWSPTTAGPARTIWNPSTAGPANAAWNPELVGATWSTWSPTTARASWNPSIAAPASIAQSPSITWKAEPFLAFRKFEAGHLPVAQLRSPSAVGLVLLVAAVVASATTLAVVARARGSLQRKELPEVEELLAGA